MKKMEEKCLGRGMEQLYRGKGVCLEHSEPGLGPWYHIRSLESFQE